MKRVMYFKLAGVNFHIPKLIGSFLIVISLLMFFKASATMIDSWDNIKYVNGCLTDVKSSSTEMYNELFAKCQYEAKQALDIYVRPRQDELNSKQFAEALLGPISSALFWIIIIALGIVFYKTGDFIVPIEQTVRDLPTHRKVHLEKPVVKQVKLVKKKAKKIARKKK